ncbi:MAG TPA: hypothetical protein QF753_00775 [Victivallales bacterium]|nr:hypothetical protein [Victivallales bacterium]
MKLIKFSFITLITCSLIGLTAACSKQKNNIETTAQKKDSFTHYGADYILTELKPFISKYNRVSNVIIWTCDSTNWFYKNKQISSLDISYKINKTNLKDDLNYATKFDIALLKYLKNKKYNYDGSIIKTTYNNYDYDSGDALLSPINKGDILLISVPNIEQIGYAKISSLENLVKLSIPKHTFVEKL